MDSHYPSTFLFQGFNYRTFCHNFGFSCTLFSTFWCICDSLPPLRWRLQKRYSYSFPHVLDERWQFAEEIFKIPLRHTDHSLQVQVMEKTNNQKKIKRNGPSIELFKKCIFYTTLISHIHCLIEYNNK